MHPKALRILRCPDCGCELRLDAPAGEPELGGLGVLPSATIEHGSLSCTGCSRSFSVRDGIPCFVERAALTGLNRRFARFYDGFSWIYTGTMRLTFLLFGGERKARMAVLDDLRPAGARVLEVAIGPCSNVPFLLELPGVSEVWGLDVSLGQLRRGRVVAARRGWPVALFQGEGEALPFADASFDSVLQLGGINFFNDRRAAIEEMLRVARPGARIVIADERERVPRGAKAPAEPLASLVPPGMEELRNEGVWRAHGKDHGYCISFTKPG